MNSELVAQRILVTGGAGGIGQAVVRALAAEGAAPIVHFHRSEQRARALAAEVGSEAVGADLRDEAAVERMFDTCLAGRRIHAVVVNAGTWAEDYVSLQKMSLAQWQATLEADLTSAFLTCRGFLRHLADDPREKAAVVLVGSTAALFGEAGHADYAAAKAGMAHGLTASLKNEIVHLAPRGRVNCVCPGWVRTEMAAGALEDEATVARATATMALRKVATPEDIARTVVYLCSDALAGHVTGAIVPVAGGMEGRLLHLPR